MGVEHCRECSPLRGLQQHGQRMEGVRHDGADDLQAEDIFICQANPGFRIYASSLKTKAQRISF